MSGFFSVRNFEKFQHYKDRNPPWIRLYNSVLDDYEFGLLTDASKAHVLAIWLLASRYDNKIPYDAEWVARRINATDHVALDELAERGFIVIDQGCSETLAERKQDAKPEERRVEERREDKIDRRDDAPKPKAELKKGTRLPDNWTLSLADAAYAKLKGVPDSQLQIEAEKFRNHWTNKTGKDATKLDWSRTWQTWILNCCDFKGYTAADGGQVRESVQFIPTHDARWVTLAERFLRENGKAPPQMAGVGGSGRHFPQSWVDDCLEIPTSLKRSEEAA